MSTPQALIVKALNNRFSELRQTRVLQLVPKNFHDAAQFVSQVREQLMNATPESLGNSASMTPNVWVDSENDCLSSLRALSLEDSLRFSDAAHPAIDSFVQELAKHKRDPVQRFQLLTERYACPVNFALPAENKIREHVLTSLMVQDRARIEQHCVASVDADDLLLKLNLVATHAQNTSDLRFLDALNYYYELLPADWVPRARHKWLLASYLGLYARALAAGILRIQAVAHSDTREHPARRSADL